MLHTWVTKGSQDLWRRAVLLFSKSASKRRMCVWNCDDRYVLECLWPENQEFQSKKVIEDAVTLAGVRLHTVSTKSAEYFLDSEEGVSLITMNAVLLFMMKNIHIVDLINSPETCLCAAGLFHCTMPNPRGPGCHMVPYESAHCDDNFAGLPDPALCCGISMCVFSVLFVSKTKVRKLWGTMREWVFGTGPICPCPPSHRAIGPDRARPGKVQPDVVSWHTGAWMAKCRML